MKRKTKKFWFTICITILLVCTFGLGLVACQKSALKITFREPPYAYQRGDIVDAYDLIEREDGVSYSFAFSYLTLSDDGQSTVSSTLEEVKGNTYFLVEASRYTLKVTAKKGNQSVSDSTQFDVVGTDPILLPPAVSLVRSVGSRALVDTLLAYAAPTVIPLSSDLSVDYYTYQESQAPTLLDTANTNPKVKTETSVDDWITFDKLGLYEFHMIAKNGEGEADAFFKVKVLPDQSTTVEGISAYKNAEFGTNADGEVDSSVMRLVGSSDLSQAAYAVLEEDFQDGQVARFEFYGKNMPSYIGLYNADTNVTEPNSLTNGRGFVFTVERASVEGHTRLYGPTRISSDTVILIDSNETYPLEHFGFGELEDGVHYFFEIAMKTTGSTATRKESKPYGASWLVGKQTQNMALYFSLYSVNEGNSDEPYTLVAHSQAKFERDNPALGLYEVGEEITGKLVAYSSISRDVTFKYHKDTLIDNDTFDSAQITFDEQTKILEWEEVDGAESYVVNMGDVSSDRIAVLDKHTCSIDLSETYARLENNNVYTFNVYASVGNNTFSDKKYVYRFVKGDWGVVDGESISYDETEKKVNVSLEGRHAASVAHFQTDVGYLAFGDTYTLDENGTYVDVYFTGNNMPQVEFFATDILGNIKNKDGDTTSKGFIVTNGHAHQSAYNETPTGGVGGYSAYDLFYEYGVTTYDRLIKGSAGELGGARISQKDGTYHYVKKDGTSASVEYSDFSMYSLMIMQSETQNYRYTVGMFKDSQGGVWIDSKLYKLNGTTEELFVAWRAKVKVYAEQENIASGQTISGKIVLHASYKGNAANAGEHFYNRFTCGTPYQGNAAAYPLVDGGKLDESNNAVILNGGNVNGATKLTKNSGYIAFKNPNAQDGKFVLDENGTYMDFYFTGNNMPNVEFFGSTISGDMFSDGTNTGYVVSNGSGRTALYTKYAQRYGHMADVGWLTANATDGGSYPYGGFALYPHYFSYGITDYNKLTQASG